MLGIYFLRKRRMKEEKNDIPHLIYTRFLKDRRKKLIINRKINILSVCCEWREINEHKQKG